MNNTHQFGLLLRVSVKLHNQHCTWHRANVHPSCTTYAIRTAFALADRLQIAGRKDTTNHLHIQVVSQRIWHIIRCILNTVAGSLGLHLAGEVVLLHAHCHANLIIRSFLHFLGGLQSAQPLAYLCLEGFIRRIYITYKEERKVSRVSKTCFVHLQRFVQRSLLQQRLIHNHGAVGVVACHHLNRVRPCHFRVLVAVSQLRL